MSKLRLGSDENMCFHCINRYSTSDNITLREGMVRGIFRRTISTGHFEYGTMDAETYQQDSATSRIHNLSQKSCANHFPQFIPKIHWPPHSDYNLWNESGEATNWDYVTTRVTLIEEIKRSVKKTFQFCT